MYEYCDNVSKGRKREWIRIILSPWGLYVFWRSLVLAAVQQCAAVLRFVRTANKGSECWPLKCCYDMILNIQWMLPCGWDVLSWGTCCKNTSATYDRWLSCELTVANTKYQREAHCHSRLTDRVEGGQVANTSHIPQTFINLTPGCRSSK